MNAFGPPSMISSCRTQWMKPTTLESASATSSSFFLTALCTDFSRPEIGFQSNHSDRRLSTPGASVINALLTTSPLDRSPLLCYGRSSLPLELRSRDGRPFLPARQPGRNPAPRETLSMIGADQRGLKDPQLSSSRLSGQA